MQAPLTAIAICILDWTVAIRGMAYDEGKWKPFYERVILGADLFHWVGRIRYLAFAVFAWYGFGQPVHWDGFTIHPNIEWRWWLGTAVLDAAGWLVLKILHGKTHWGWTPRWFR